MKKFKVKLSSKTPYMQHRMDDTITQPTIKEIIENAGNYIGIGSFRPTNNGMFGRFQLDSIKAL